MKTVDNTESGTEGAVSPRRNESNASATSSAYTQRPAPPSSTTAAPGMRSATKRASSQRRTEVRACEGLEVVAVSKELRRSRSHSRACSFVAPYGSELGAGDRARVRKEES